jgi:hypothetical protein
MRIVSMFCCSELESPDGREGGSGATSGQLVAPEREVGLTRYR